MMTRRHALLASARRRNAGPTLLIHDDFTGTAGTSLGGRLADTVSNGNTWSVFNGAFALDGAGAVNGTSGSAPYNMAAIDAGVADCTVEAVGVFGASASALGGGLYVRASNSSNGWIIRATRTDPELRIVERNAGTETDRATSGTVNCSPGDIVTVTVVLSGTSIQATLLNQTTGLSTNVSFTSSFQQSVTTHGIYSRQQAYFTEHREFRVSVP